LRFDFCDRLPDSKSKFHAARTGRDASFCRPDTGSSPSAGSTGFCDRAFGHPDQSRFHLAIH
jgi:hypothetical protein